MLLLGPTDVGKTTTAAAIVRELLDGPPETMKRCLGIRWTTAAGLVSAHLEHPLGHGKAPEVSKAMTCRLLVLNDLGNGDRGHQVLFEILDYRKEHRLPVITTSGLTKKQLLEPPYGDCWVRRLIQRDGKNGIVVVAKAKP